MDIQLCSGGSINIFRDATEENDIPPKNTFFSESALPILVKESRFCDVDAKDFEGIPPSVGEDNTVFLRSTSENEEATLSQFSGSYSPKSSDTLFWCIYIIANGYGEYMNIDRNYGVKELEIRKKVCEYLQKNPTRLKGTNYKITKAGTQEVISDLLTSTRETNYSCLLALIVYYHINIAVLRSNGKIMLEFYSDSAEETPYYILKMDTYGKYSVDTDKKTWKEVQEMKNQCVCLENYMKPLKAMGHYKIADLETLAAKLGVFDITKKYKKLELYQIVYEATKLL